MTNRSDINIIPSDKNLNYFQAINNFEKINNFYPADRGGIGSTIEQESELSSNESKEENIIDRYLNHKINLTQVLGHNKESTEELVESTKSFNDKVDIRTQKLSKTMTFSIDSKRHANTMNNEI